MMAIETALHGGRITLGIIPQDRERAETLREEILSVRNDAYVAVAEISGITDGFDLVINATPMGMYPKTDACAVSDSVIEKSAYFFDAVYNPTKTLFIRKAEALGKTAAGGAAMLVYQAVKAHEIWYRGSFAAEDISGIITAVEQEVDRMNAGGVK